MCSGLIYTYKGVEIDRILILIQPVVVAVLLVSIAISLLQIYSLWFGKYIIMRALLK